MKYSICVDCRKECSYKAKRCSACSAIERGKQRVGKTFNYSKKTKIVTSKKFAKNIITKNLRYRDFFPYQEKVDGGCVRI